MRNSINHLVSLCATGALLLTIGGCKPHPGEEPLSGLSEDSPVTYHKGDDPDFLHASHRAQASFKYFWKQVAFDFNRVIPALEVASMKFPFSDDPSDSESLVENMWVGEIDFDGEVITGVLLNTPNWLKTVKEGDKVQRKPDEIGDWMCAIGGKVYGGYTVQVIRGRMNDEQRATYDAQWGLDFPPPDHVRVPNESDPTLFKEFETVIANGLKEHLKENPTAISETDDEGRTPLHREALFGRTESTKVLLSHDASLTTKCNRGWTPRDYANSLNWTNVLNAMDSAKE